MNTDDIVPAEAVSIEAVDQPQKRPWIAPFLILERAEFVTLGKSPDPTEMSAVVGLGPAS